MKILLISALLILTISVLHAEEKMSANAQEVNSACAPDGATAGCGSDKVGTGLLKCIHAYKKEHKDFKLSKECRSAVKKMRTANHEKKAEQAKEDAKKVQ